MVLGGVSSSQAVLLVAQSSSLVLCARPSLPQVPSLCRQSNRMVRRKCWDQGWDEAVSPLAVLGLDLLCFHFFCFSLVCLASTGQKLR